MSLALSPRRAILMPGPWVRDELWRRARAVPSLDLRFAERKDLIDVISGLQLITYTRAGSGTFVGSGGLAETAGTNVPRFDHNPITGECLGLLVEEQRANLLLQSENFGTTWAANGLLAFGIGSTLNAITAPDGTITADLITENTATAQHNVSQTVATIGQKTFSVFAKQGPGNRLFRLVDFNATNGAQGETYFNLSTGAVVSGTGTIRAFSNGWYRCSITTTTTVTSTYFISISSGNGVFSYTGNGTSGIYIWGAQLEAGAFPTSYIPTTTAAVTRNADIVSITGTNFSSWYRQDEGTIFASCQNTQNTSGVVFGVGDTFDNTIYVTAATANNVFWLSGGIYQGAISASISSLLSNVIVTYRANDLAATSNGGTISTDTSGAVPINPVRLKIGSSAWESAGTNIPGGHIRRLTYWPQRLSNSTLQTLTR